MIDKAYIQKRGGEFINETAYSMWQGCRMLGIETDVFDADNFRHVQITKETLVHGNIGVVKDAVKSLGVEEIVPQVDGFPPSELIPYYGRHLWTSDMGKIRTGWAEDKHLFIKPLHVQKAFNGHVTSGKIADLIQTASFPDDFEVMCSDTVNFVSEYRLFVHRGIIVDARFYRGDYTKLVDIQHVGAACVNAYKSSPVAYSLDLGLTDDGRTVVVEVNDHFALGAYGTPSIGYAQRTIDRWEEIVGER